MPNPRPTVVLTVLALALVGGLRSQELALALPSDNWLIVSIGGVDSGWSHRVRERVTIDGVELVRTRESGGLRMQRLGANVEISGDTVSLESLAGKPVRVESRNEFSARESIAIVEFEGRVAKLQTTTAGRTQTTERTMAEDLLGPFALECMILGKAGEPGAEIEATIWSPDVGQAADVYVKVVGRERIEVGPGDARELLRVEIEIEAMGLRTTTWYDGAGRDVMSEGDIAGLKIRTRQVSEAEADALRLGDGGATPDVFAPSMVKEPYFLPAPRRVERAVVLVRSRQDGAADTIVQDDRQRRLGVRADGGVLIELRTTTPPPGLGGVRPLVDPSSELRAALAPNSAIQCDAPEIVRLMRIAVGEERDAWRAAQAIERWVGENVTDKNFDVGFASALEVAEDRSGDCSEHAVLLAAMCRAAGIPSRVVMGLLYIGGIWGGHAWNEVWIDGRWYALDGTLAMGRADALHLTMAKMTLEDGNAGSEFAALATGLGKFDLEVLEMSVTQTVRPQEESGQVEGDRWVDRAFGIAFTLPAGATADGRRPEQGLGFEIARFRVRPQQDDGWRLSVRAYDPGPDGAWPEFLPVGDAEAWTLDGRPALRKVKSERDETTIRVVVRAGANVFELKFEDVTPPARAAVDALLDSVDFDR